jgi:hypothetical protein
MGHNNRNWQSRIEAILKHNYKHNTDSGWTVVIYMDMVDSSDKMELVWSQYGKPYAQQITPSDDGVGIARLILSQKPYVASESEALYEMLQNLGTM